MLGSALVAAMVLAGCVSLPTSGPVEQVAPRAADGDSLVQVIPSGPGPNARPVDVVRGWLTAMRAFPVSTDVARSFLTEEAAQSWDPSRRTRIYSSYATSAARAISGGVRVELRTRPVARLNSRGAFTPVSGRAEQTQTLRLVQTPEDGYRLTEPPDELLLSEAFFTEYFRPFDLYFFDRTGDALIPDPVWLPLGDQLATRLVAGLLAGPSSWLGNQATTALTADPASPVSVPVRSDGVAMVQLGESAARLSDTQRKLLSAQLAWTLQQVAGVESVQLSVDGAPLVVPGAGSTQSAATWAQYDPSGPPSRSQLYGVRRGAVVTVEEGKVRPVNGWWGSSAPDAAAVSVERSLARIAVVDTAGVLKVGPYVTDDGEDVQPWYSSSGRLRDPQWDRTGRLWALDRSRGGAQVVLVTDGTWRYVPIGRLAAAGIREMAVSPGGARVAALVDRWPPRRNAGSASAGGPARGPADGPTLVVARVVRSATGAVRRLDRAYAVDPAELRVLASPAWAAPAQVGVLARLSGDTDQPYRIAIDGSLVAGGSLSGDPLLGPVGARTLAASGVGGAQTTVGAADGRLYALDSQTEWSQLARSVRAPRYAD